MDLAQEIIDRTFSPIFFSLANFTVFAGVLGLGAITGSLIIIFASLGFFIAGSVIFALHIADKWAQGNLVSTTSKHKVINPYAAKQEIAQMKMEKVVQNAMPKDNNQIQASIEL